MVKPAQIDIFIIFCREVGIAAYMANQVLANLRRLLLQRNLELLPNTLDSLEAALKKVK